MKNEIETLKERLNEIINNDISYLYDVTCYDFKTKNLKNSRIETIMEWLNDFPEYFKSYSCYSNRIIICNCLYRF